MARKPRVLSDRSRAERIQSILINAALGRRSLGDDRDYTALRKQLRRRPFVIPETVATHPTVNSFHAYIKGIEDRAAREALVRKSFAPLFKALDKEAQPKIDAASWTGIEGPSARIATIRHLLPVARASVEGLIAMLAEPGDNGGPILDGREEAIGHLRKLHAILGDLLNAVDSGHFTDGLGEGMMAEAARYAKRAARALRDDPMPYLASGLLLGVLEACGFPTIGAYMAGVAQAIQKSAGTQARS